MAKATQFGPLEQEPLRIAYFSPLKPIRSGVSGFSEDLLPELARYCELELFVDGYEPSSYHITSRFLVHDWTRDKCDDDQPHDLPMYHLGNNPYHAYMLKAMTRWPGVTVLHDAVLHHLVVEETLAKGKRGAYAREMSYACGGTGAYIGMQVAAGLQSPPHFDYPLIRRVADRSFGIVVHSKFARDLVVGASPETRVVMVPLFSSTSAQPKQSRVERARRRLGIEPAEFVLASFGFATPAKRVEVVLRAFARFSRGCERARFLWVGEHPDWYDVSKLICELGLADTASITGYVDDDEFDEYIAAADVCLNLRYPTAGESSAALLRLMGLEKATIVTDTAWFSELPSDCCVKVEVGPHEEDSLVAAMKMLAEDEGWRRRLGHNARQHVEQHHRLEDAARGYADVLREVWEEIVAG